MAKPRRPHPQQGTSSTPHPRVGNYRRDPLYPRVTRAVDALLAKGNVVAPVDVLIGMNLLNPTQLEAWRLGRVPYLEKVIDCNLTRLSRLLRILRFHVHDLNLAPSTTAYMRWGRGPKQRLRFTKTGDERLEAAYSQHFIWPGKAPFHQRGPRCGSTEQDPMHGQKRQKRQKSQKSQKSQKG